MVECNFKKNEKILNTNSKIGAKTNERLQVLLSPSTNWNGLAEEIVRACNDTEIEVFFRGRKIDYDDLEYCLNVYEGNAAFKIGFEETANDNDMIREFDKLFAEIQNKDLPDFKQTNSEGKDIFDAYEEVKNGIFEVSVIATMSSGKSTLINSLLHTELLPSENKACTATIARILDNDDMSTYKATCYSADETEIIYSEEEITPELLRVYNLDERVTFIDIEGSVPAIPSNKIRLCLRDTPGPNNSRNENHGKLTSSIIKRTNAVVLYVMNATQIGIKDDMQLLLDISNEMKRAGKQSRDRFIFVINKCDELDEEKGETIDKLIIDVKDYLKEFGIIEPTIIPTSARLALLVRKDKKGETLTRQERRELSTVDDFVERELLHFEKSATLTPTIREKLVKKVEEYHKDEELWDLEALIHSGVPAVEETIIEYIEKYAYPMKIKDAIKDIIQILDELDMKAKFDASIAGDSERLDTIRKQIRMAKEKNANSQVVYDSYKQKIEKFNLKSIDKKEEERKIEKALNKMTEKYDNKTSVDKIEADRMIEDFQTKLDFFQTACESEITRLIDEKIFSEGSKMLDEYSKAVVDILQDIEIEGYDFRKVSSFGKIKINNLQDIAKQNEKDRYKDENRWKDNPERTGFFGKFKFWKPKQVSYTVQVKDGIDVDVRNIIVGIMTEFAISAKKNVVDMFEQAENQIQGYKNAFKDNIDNLQMEITNIIVELEEKTAEFAMIEERVAENKALAEWVALKENELRTLVSF